MTLQQIIETLLRSRLYRTRVSVENAAGEVTEGLVQELRYDGSRSVAVIADAGVRPHAIPLATIARVQSLRSPRKGAAA